MNYTPRLTFGELVAAMLVLGLFVFALWGANHYSEKLLTVPLIGGVWGMFLYFLLATVATVLAPFSTFPLLPVGAAVWGPLITALLSIAGWGLGAMIAFLIARRYGQPLVGRFVNLTKAEKLAQSIAGKHPFWSIVVARMLLPTDILSYAIGLFLPIPLGTYLLATFIGITPFAFVFSYTSELPLYAQVTLVVAILMLLFVCYRRFRATQV